MRELVLGQLPIDARKDKHIPFGPWSFAGREDLHREFLGFPSLAPYDGPAEKESMAFHCEMLMEEVLVLFSDYMNELWKTNYPVDFWKLLMMPWLSEVVQFLEDRKRRVSKAVELYGEECLLVRVIDRGFPTFQSSDEFVKMAFQKEFNEWLVGHLVKQARVESWEVVPISTSGEVGEEESIGVETVPKSRRSPKEYIGDILDALPFGGRGYGISPVNQILFSLVCFLKGRKRCPNEFDGPTHSKQEVSKEAVVCFEECKSFLPQCYYSETKLKNGGKRIFPSNLYVCSTELLVCESKRYKLGKRRLKGARVYSMQHGGVYGTTKRVGLPGFEYDLDGFFSWGWSEHAHYKVNAIALPSAFISTKKPKQVPAKKRMMFVSHPFFVNNYRTCGAISANDSWSGLVSRKEFFDTLDATVIEETSYRPFYHPHLDLEVDKVVLEGIPNMSFVKSDFHEALSQSKLVVMDNPATTFNYVLAWNIPVVGFWDETKWEPCYQARPFFSRLESVGVIHSCGKDAANFINGIFDNVEGWWHSDDVQSAREEWCWLYARSSKNWRREWLNALVRL